MNILSIYQQIVKLIPKDLKKKFPEDIRLIEISEAVSRKLNKKYRRVGGPTNVLSFRYGKDYGEILVCPQVVRREARKQGNSYQYQVTWMVLHGMLHLAGLHHEKSKKDACRVFVLEQKILSKVF